MIYLLTYLSDNEQRTLEWVTPKGWTTVEIAKHFEKRFPDAKLLSMARTE